MKRTAPCMGCTDRRVGCHGECWRYKDWAEEMAEAKRARREEQRLSQALNDIKEKPLRKPKGKW